MDQPVNQTSQRPYLIRAMHQWMTDNGLTPHIIVDAATAGLQAPPNYAKDGRLILNISYSATQHLQIGDESVSFRARFGGVAHDLIVPVRGVLGIYARESGQGMVFSNTDQAASEDGTRPAAGSEADGSIVSTEATGTRPSGRPELKIIK